MNFMWVAMVCFALAALGVGAGLSMGQWWHWSFAVWFFGLGIMNCCLMD